jgi:hypothetical protein
MFDNKIICPVCGDTFVHIETAVNKNGEDNYQAWEGRGDAVEIPMWCEHDHNWIMILGFHKGNTYVFNRVIETSTKLMGIKTEE